MIRPTLVLATAVATTLLVLTAAGCGGNDDDAPRPAAADVVTGDLGSGLTASKVSNERNAFGGNWFVVSPAGDEIAGTGNRGSGY